MKKKPSEHIPTTGSDSASAHGLGDLEHTPVQKRRITFLGRSRVKPIVPVGGGTPVGTFSTSEYRKKVLRPQRRLKEGASGYIAKKLYFEFFFNGLLDKAAILSFFTLLTALPTLLSFYAISSLLLDQNRNQVLELTEEFIGSYVPPEYADNARSIVDVVIGSTEQSAIMLVLSILVALFSSSAYVRAFSRNANDLYGRVEGRPLARALLTMWVLTFTLLLGLVFIAGAYFLRQDIVNPLLNRFAEPLGIQDIARVVVDQILPVWNILRWPVIIAVAIGLVSLLYHVAPNVNYGRYRWLTAGGVFALAGVFTVGTLTNLYATIVGPVGLYGALGGLITGLIGIWLSNAFMLLGVAMNVEVTRVRELQAGYDAVDQVLVPPRSSRAIAGYNAMVDKLHDRALELTPLSEDEYHNSDGEVSATSEKRSHTVIATKDNVTAPKLTSATDDEGSSSEH